MADWVSPTAIHSKCGQETGFPATDFIDGNTSSSWIHYPNELHWIVVDLGETLTVEKIRVNLVTSDAAQKWESVDIYVSDDPASWGAAVATGVDFLGPTGWQEAETTDKDGRYIKLEGIDTQHGAGSVRGMEFEAYAAAVVAEVAGYAFVM